MMRVLKRVFKIYLILILCYFSVFKLISLIFHDLKENTHSEKQITKALNIKSSLVFEQTTKQSVNKIVHTNIKSNHSNADKKELTITKFPKKKTEEIKSLKKERSNINNKKSWKKKIAFRRKNFGRLEEWESDPEMKKILLWTGYGPQQEGMLLWKRVFNSIGKYTKNIKNA